MPAEEPELKNEGASNYLIVDRASHQLDCHAGARMNATGSQRAYHFTKIMFSLY